MAVPTYDQFVEPVLRYLAAHPDGAAARDVHEAAARVLRMSDSDRAEVLPSGVQLVYKNRAGWAHDRLKRAGLSASRRRGYWQLTDAGVAFAKTQPSPLPPTVLESILREFNDVRLRPLGDQDVPTTSRADLLRVGRSGDGGIDGVISLDRLGLEKVYVQAKRWQGSVGRPEVQAFYGALAGQRANRGVFITTSTFTQQAVEFAGSVERIVLVDGSKLADLMIEYEVGVASRAVRIPKIDSDYFEE